MRVNAGLLRLSALRGGSKRYLRHALRSLGILLPGLGLTIRPLRGAEIQWRQVIWMLLPIAGLVILALLCAQPPEEGCEGPPLVRATSQST